MKTFLNVSISICHHCGTPYADASWYTGLSCEVECGKCGRSWIPAKSIMDTLLIEFRLDQEGKIKDIKKKS
jgi:hypothetical protein